MVMTETTAMAERSKLSVGLARAMVGCASVGAGLASGLGKVASAATSRWPTTCAWRTTQQVGRSR